MDDDTEARLAAIEERLDRLADRLEAFIAAEAEELRRAG